MMMMPMARMPMAMPSRAARLKMCGLNSGRRRRGGWRCLFSGVGSGDHKPEGGKPERKLANHGNLLRRLSHQNGIMI
jgi:hypothetical protein